MRIFVLRWRTAPVFDPNLLGKNISSVELTLLTFAARTIREYSRCREYHEPKLLFQLSLPLPQVSNIHGHLMRNENLQATNPYFLYRLLRMCHIAESPIFYGKQ